MQTPDVHRLAQNLEHLLRLIRRVATSGDLSMPAAAVISRLATYGPQRLSDLAVVEGSSQPGMTQLVTRLERGGFVRRDADTTDGRAVVVSVTPAGRRLSELRRTERAQALERLVQALDPEHRAALSAAMPALDRLADLAQHAMASTRTTTPTGARI